MEKIIKQKLKEIEKKENVKILFAVESGSRAWGFESPDSDYDVRFVYVRKLEDYLLLKPKRDVIEWQLDETLDINGWDIQKTLLLIYKSNPTIFEWLESPIVYYKTKEYGKLKKLIKRFFICKNGVHHYLHMAERNNREYLQEDNVKLKKYFYVLRSILAAKWIIDKGTNPPMQFDDLIKTELDSSIKPIVNKLLEKKRKTPELGKDKRINILNDYIDKEITSLNNQLSSIKDNKNDYELLDDFFKSLFI